MATIYSLETDGVVWYVGSTRQSPKQRFREHRCKKDSFAGSYQIPEDYEYTLKVLETCPEETRFERETYWFNALKPLFNIRHPPTSRQEVLNRWTAANLERRREQARRYAAKAYARKKSEECLRRL